MPLTHRSSGRTLVRRSSGVLTLAIAGIFSSAQAAEFVIEPRIEAGGIYNDNYRVVPDGEDDVQGALADVGVNFRSSTPTSDFNIRPRLRSTYFPDDREDDYNNVYLDSAYEYRGLTSKAGFRALYSREDLLNSELPEADTPGADLGEDSGVGSGVVTLDNRRDLIRLAPYGSVNLTERQTLEGTLEYLDADYAEDALGSNTDFTSLSGAVGIGFGLSPTQRLRFDVVGTQYNPDSELTGDSTSYGVRGEYWTNRSEIWQSYLRLGVERTSQDDPAIGEAPDDSTNVIFGAGLNATYQVTRFFVDASSAVRPNSSGELVSRDELRFRVNRNFTPRVAGIAAVRYVRDSAAQDQADYRDRRYLVGSLGVEWRLSREWALLTNYDYRRQKYEGDSGEGTSNQVVVSIVYEPRRDL